MESSFRFGSTTGPCKYITSERAQMPEENGEKSNCDPDRLLQCPFDKNHQIRSCRFPYHLIKCRKNHPKLASELKTCPFNARHLVPKDELTYHTENCEDRITVDDQDCVGTNGPCHSQVPVSTWVNPNMTEDWDQEADDHAVPFVWGANGAFEQKPAPRPTNSLGQGFRTPSAFPW